MFFTGYDIGLVRFFVALQRILCFRFQEYVLQSWCDLALRDKSHADTPADVSVSMNVLSIATNLARILRNMCTNNSRNQDTVISHGIHIIVRAVMLFQIDLFALSRQASLGSRRYGVVGILWTVPPNLSSTIVQRGLRKSRSKRPCLAELLPRVLQVSRPVQHVP